MGLDLTHSKLVLEPVDQGDILLLEELPPAPRGYSFDPYLQDVPDQEYLHTIYFTPDSTLLDYLMIDKEANAAKPDRTSLLLGNRECCELELMAIEKKYALSRAQAWFSSACIIKDRKQYRYQFAIYSRPCTSRGAYYIEAGYQRKGMVEQFYSDYKNELYVEYSRFLALPNYLDPELTEHLLPNLITSFINNYEPGRSLLRVST
jgi:hypothetical protein